MSRALVVLWNAVDREKVSRWAAKAPPGTRVEFRATKRSLPQSARMWAMLGEIASQKTWHGVRLSAADYKLLFMDALQRELRIVPNLSGNGFVNLGRSSSDLSKEEMSDLIEIITAWGVEQGIKFNDPAGIAA